MNYRFCEYQIKTKENPEGWDCIGHIHEGRCFKCCYKINDIQYDSENNKIFISTIEGSLAKGACQDFKVKIEDNDVLEKIMNSVLEKLKNK